MTSSHETGWSDLASHLPAAEIAAELFVSVHTVKSQQASLYRKLGTSSRSQAVARARQLGLLKGKARPFSSCRGGCSRAWPEVRWYLDDK